jgi:hypothetical protein
VSGTIVAKTRAIPTTFSLCIVCASRAAIAVLMN